MKDNNLKHAQQEIEEALTTIEKLEENLKSNNLSQNTIKENFMTLSKRVQEIEEVLKSEGIL